MVRQLSYRRPINPLSIEYPEDYKRRVESFRRGYLKYESNIHEKQRMAHWILKSQAKPEHVCTYVTGLTRTRLQPGQFEDAEGNLIYGLIVLRKDCRLESLS